MYAQSRPMPPPVRVPDHYSGNAFRADAPPPKERVEVSAGAAPHEVEGTPTLPVRSEADAATEDTPGDIPESAVSAPEHTPLLPRPSDGGLTLGIGNEELLLLGLIFLLYSAGSNGREELLLCLVLLLGGG